jgi:hypothetical protein
MYIFNFHPETGAYLGGSPAEYDQLEPGRVLVPAWSTNTPPPGGFDSAVQWPYFVAATGKWELRMLATPAAPEPAAPVEQEVADPIEVAKATLQFHLDAAQLLVDQLKATT